MLSGKICYAPAAAVMLLGLVERAHGDRIILNSGVEIRADVVERTKHEIILEFDKIRMTLPASNVRNVEKGETESVSYLPGTSEISSNPIQRRVGRSPHRLIFHLHRRLTQLQAKRRAAAEELTRLESEPRMEGRTVFRRSRAPFRRVERSRVTEERIRKARSRVWGLDRQIVEVRDNIL